MLKFCSDLQSVTRTGGEKGKGSCGGSRASYKFETRVSSYALGRTIGMRQEVEDRPSERRT